MSDFNRGEKLSIKDSSKSLKRYGSTSNHVKKPDFYIEHNVMKTDTLQGLALKYNTTTEQIRRVNRLFSSDSLFLRTVLKIPVQREVAESKNGRNSNHSSSESTSESATATSSVSTESFSDDEHKSANDFLCKIDSAIASTRAQVKHIQKHSDFVDPTDPTSIRRKNSRRQVPASLESASATDVPHPVVLNHGRKVRNSLQRLEKEQDAIFEL